MGGMPLGQQMGGMRPMGGMGAPLAPPRLPSPAPSPSHRPEAHSPVSPPHNTVEKGGAHRERHSGGHRRLLPHTRLAGAPPRRRRDAAADAAAADDAAADDATADATASDAAADGRDAPARDGHAADGLPGARPVRTRLHAGGQPVLLTRRGESRSPSQPWPLEPTLKGRRLGSSESAAAISGSGHSGGGRPCVSDGRCASQGACGLTPVPMRALA